jgi:DNA polymerase sigma
VDLCITTPWGGLRNVRTLAKLFRKSKRERKLHNEAVERKLTIDFFSGGMQHVVCVPRAKVPIVRLFDPEL